MGELQMQQQKLRKNIRWNVVLIIITELIENTG